MECPFSVHGVQFCAPSQGGICIVENLQRFSWQYDRNLRALKINNKCYSMYLRKRLSYSNVILPSSDYESVKFLPWMHVPLCILGMQLNSVGRCWWILIMKEKCHLQKAQQTVTWQELVFHLEYVNIAITDISIFITRDIYYCTYLNHHDTYSLEHVFAYRWFSKLITNYPK